MSTRKLKSDGIRKKIKVNYHESTRKMLNQILSILYPDSKKMFLEKLSQKFLTSINIKQNKNIMTSSLYDIYKNDVDENNHNYLHNLEVISKASKNPIFTDIMNTKYSDLFEKYLDSERYKYDLKKIMEKEDKSYLDLYCQHARDYVSYFSSKRANIRKHERNRMRRKLGISNVTTPSIVENSG